MDFVVPCVKTLKKGLSEVSPKFIVKKSKDLMIRGHDFYAVWDETEKVWSTDQETVIKLVDSMLEEFAESYSNNSDGSETVIVKRMSDSDSGSMDKWKKYTQKHMADNWVSLNGKLVFSNTKPERENYSSHHLNYPLKKGDHSAYDELIDLLYSPEEKMKIEWAIGSVVSGDSVKIQKFIVFTGDAGTGKSTVMKIIRMLFDGYTATIDAKAISSPQSSFALESLKSDPLVAIQDDADLTGVRDNTRLNSLISHEYMTVNEKYKSPYEHAYRCFIFLGSNGDVQITDSRSGLQRRLIDVRPTGKTFKINKYLELMERIKFELSGIAYHCLEVYKNNKHAYDNYKPTQTMRNTNIFYNFMEENYDKYEYRIGLKTVWEDYNRFCDESNIAFRFNRLEVLKEARPYFKDFIRDGHDKDGNHVRSVFFEILPEKFGLESSIVDASPDNWIIFNGTFSKLDIEYGDCPAQYSKDDGTPRLSWDKVKTKLKDLYTRKLHWVRLPENVIKIDFDKKDKDGNKSLELNLMEANKFPKTYAEVSKSGCGIHLYYIYDGDPNELSRIYDENIEVKVSTGKNSHRRILTKCNDLPIAHISTGLPLKGGKPMMDANIAINEKGLRTTIQRCIAKEIHADTRSNIDWICEILDRAYNSGIVYDVSDMRPDVLRFAMHSTNQSEYCVNKISEMKFKSESAGEYDASGYRVDDPIIFFDFEVKPNMNLLCWKKHGPDEKVIDIFNPSPEYIGEFFGFNSDVKNKIVGYNNKDYDNHIAYAIYNGKTPEEVFNISQAIINKEKDAKYREAKHMSYSDVFDFLPDKISLKKWEIRLGISHKEFEHPWDEPIPEELWGELAKYCEKDVLATEAVFDSEPGQAAWKGRCILCDLANILRGPGSTVNDSTNDLTTKLIVGSERNPQRYFVYPNLADEFPGYEYCKTGIDKDRYISKEYAKKCTSIYKGYDPSEGGFVYSEPGMYGHSVCFDVASEHPSSIIAENGFGPYTENYKLLLDLRLHIKHKEYDEIRKMYNGALAKYLETEEDADALSYALKIAINSVYGLTSASFPNRLKDPRNIDNWVAKRGALFMIDLMTAVKEMGYTVIHCKTDSIKVLNPDKRVTDYIFEYGKKFGYNFEIEHIFDRICLLNKSVYVCKYTDDKENGKMAGKWDSVGKQFGRTRERGTPYVFKTLFSHEPIEFRDVCEAKSASTALYLDMNEGLPEGESNRKFIGKTGLFTPVVDGAGGGELYRKSGEDKYDCVAGTSKPKEKGKKVSLYRWHESSTVEALNMYDKIDYSYYNRLVDEGIEDISKFGDFELFVSDEPIPLPEHYPTKPLPDFMNIPETDEEELPFL